MSKKCTPLWREAHFQVKMYKAHHGRTTFGRCDVEKVHAVVARSIFSSQNVQKTTPWSDHFWKLRCRKSAGRCGSKHISKSKCTKHHMFAPLLEVQMSKKCTPLWREAHFEVKMLKALGVRTTFGSSDVPSLRFTTLITLITLHYPTLHYTPLHYTTLHYTTLHYTTLHYLPLHFTTLHYTALHYTTTTTTQLHSTTLHYTTLHYKYNYTTTLHYTALHSTALNYTTLRSTTLQIQLQLQLHNYTTLHYTTLHSLPLHLTTLLFTTLHYTTLNYTTLHYTPLHYIALH